MNLGRFIAVTAGLGLVTGAAACSVPVVTGLIAAGAFYAGFRGLFVRDISLESRHPRGGTILPETAVAIEDIKTTMEKLRKDPSYQPIRCENKHYKTQKEFHDTVINGLENRSLKPACVRASTRYFRDNPNGKETSITYRPSCDPKDIVYEFHTRPGVTREGKPCFAICTPVAVSLYQDMAQGSCTNVPMEKMVDGGELYIDDMPVYMEDPDCKAPPDAKDPHVKMGKDLFTSICHTHFKENPTPEMENKVTLDRPKVSAKE